MKRIGIDARLMYQTGVGVYIRNLLFYLVQQDLTGLELYVYARNTDIQRFLRDNPKVGESGQLKLRPCEVGWHGFAEQIFFLWQLVMDRLDLMHFTYFSWPVLYPGRFIVIVHDITPLTHTTGKLSLQNPWWYTVKHVIFRGVFSQQVKRATVVMTPTAAVKADILRYFHLDPDKIQVLYEGLSFEMPHETLSEPLPFPYFLYVGNFFPHKNVHALVQAFNEIDIAHDFRLLLVGPDNFFSRQLELTDRVSLHTDVEQQDLADLYMHAYALVFPSLAEGFGLPLVEAMSYGTPLVISDIPVFHEIAQTQALYFDPRDTQSIRKTLQSVVANMQVSPLRRTMYDHSIYSFETMTRHVLQLYRA